MDIHSLDCYMGDLVYLLKKDIFFIFVKVKKILNLFSLHDHYPFLYFDERKLVAKQ